VWAIRGEHNTVYLAGSIHLLRPAEAALPPAFEQAYGHAAALVMELDPGKVASGHARAWMQEHGGAPPGSLRRSLTGQQLERVEAEARRLEMPSAALDGEAPWLVGLQLMDLQYARAGYDAASGVEQQLERRALADGKPTQGLETVEEQLGVFGTLSAAEQARFLMLIVGELPDLPQETDSVIQAWKAGDASRLAQLLGEEYQSFPRLYHALVTQRNERWLPQIERLLTQRRDCLVVVGALHLVGKGGLLEMLRRHGHAAESVD
jgi:uncharacterized protein YbaP (TraB family)